MKILNLGCNMDIKKDMNVEWVNLDIRKLKGVDIVCDLDKFPYPIKDKEFDEVVANHVLEHLNNIPEIMDELHRILKDRGTIKIRCPYFKNESAFSSPQHKRYITEKSFEHYYYHPNSKFNLIKWKLVAKRKYKKFIPLKSLLNMFLWNIYDEIYFELRKR